MGFIDLDRAIRSQDDTRIAEVVRAFDRSTADVAVRQQLARLARETRSARIRNAAVLALVDIGHEDAAQIIVSLLREPHTAGARGTLLFALQELGVKIPIGDIVALLRQDSFETREECILALAEGRYEASPEAYREAVADLALLAEAAEPERREAMRSALAVLREPEAGPR